MDSVSDSTLARVRENVDEDTGTNWFGYKYLGPGTDVQHHVQSGVKPVNDLDAAARKHDIEYFNIKEAVASGKITKRQGEKLVDKADWALANRAAYDMVKGIASPSNVVNAFSGRYDRVLQKLVGTVPSAYTSGVMRSKWLLSKLGIGRGSFAGIRKLPNRRRR